MKNLNKNETSKRISDSELKRLNKIVKKNNTKKNQEYLFKETERNKNYKKNSKGC